MFKAFFCFTSSDVSSVLHSVEKREGMDGDAYCTPNIWESVYQGVSILAMGSSRSLSSSDEAQLWGWTENDLSSA